MKIRDRVAQFLWGHLDPRYREVAKKWADQILLVLKNEDASELAAVLSLKAIRCPECSGNGKPPKAVDCKRCSGKGCVVVKS